MFRAPVRCYKVRKNIWREWFGVITCESVGSYTKRSYVAVFKEWFGLWV